ncbi:hypothetical protein PoB_006564200 [Plakobranchus ocellatus]|uniref:Uncharacterized protein n=1 Tax=Plakobranchus ocellatus TaxID=259542 RepID=A0AAV4D4J1_9GAST|nr:hypothetical protein PoB_006564200 [Plakobranchus ocellatus]
MAGHRGGKTEETPGPRNDDQLYRVEKVTNYLGLEEVTKDYGINITVLRLGGGFGGKIFEPAMLTAASSLAAYLTDQ